MLKIVLSQREIAIILLFFSIEEYFEFFNRTFFQIFQERLKLLRYYRAEVSHHRDYKRIEWASREKSRDKLNKSNGGQI